MKETVGSTKIDAFNSKFILDPNTSTFVKPNICYIYKRVNE